MLHVITTSATCMRRLIGLTLVLVSLTVYPHHGYAELPSPAPPAPLPQLKVIKQSEHKEQREATKRDQEPSQSGAESDQSWDTSWPHAPSHQVYIDTSEGTWMSVDVSPDGRWIVFDLLGDLYRIPFEGGEAQPLRVGHHWEMQPRYSPDGRWIAFTSDAGGGDNLWVMSADPRRSQDDAWAVSQETYRLVNSPVWTPDGQALIGRKHFTSRRSLGSGEMWRYHWRGGYKGMQLTQKQSKQKDEGEPAISPDGAWLYYSQDLSPGAYFEYNKDSHKGIYGIRRLNLKSGELITLISGPGGAIRPTPSPDGKKLAFLRRVEGQTTLWVRELNSGRERLIATPLERDLQETWAIHGVYPQISWTPDSESIVYWATGQLWRVQTQTGAKHLIPFHVKQAHRLVTPLRTHRRINHQRHFPVQMLRWVRRQGRRVVFQALGHLYLADLDQPERPLQVLTHHRIGEAPQLLVTIPKHVSPQTNESEQSTSVDSSVNASLPKPSTPPQLTQVNPDLPVRLPGRVGDHERSDTSQLSSPQQRTFAFSPSWSAQGEVIVYTIWNDEHLGQIRAYNCATGDDEELSTGPGHYLNPLLSADEQWLIYQRVGGGWITSPRYVRQPGLYALHLPSGREARLAGQVGHPHFGPKQRHVYFTQTQGEELTLASVPLTAHEREPPPPKVIAKGKKLQMISLSPDGRWIAFQSDFHLWITPRPLTGKPLTLAPKQKDRPVFKLSDQSGFDPQWSSDSKHLYWHLGSTLYEAPVPDTLLARSPMVVNPKQLRDTYSSSITATHLNLWAPHPESTEAPIALVGGRVLTFETGQGLEADLIERGVVLIEGDRITRVGSYAELRDQIPSEAHIINVEDHTIIPGLIDVHAHGSHTAYGITPQSNWQYSATLTFGVTTVHDPSHHSQSIFAARELVQAGQVIGPRIFSTGTILYGAEGRVRADIQSAQDARRHLMRMKAMGAFSVKSYNQPRRNQRQQVLDEARKLEMLVVPEGGSLFHHNLTQIIDGHTGVEHAIPLARLYQDVVQLWSATEVGYTPTFNVAYGGIMGENYWYQESPVYANSRLRHFVPSRELDARARRPFTAPHGDWNHVNVARSARDLMRAGVRVNAGAHGQREGLGMHWEMWSMHQGGFTPYEALRAATLHGAHYLGLDRDLGRVAPGYLADLAIIKGDVLRDLRLSERVAWVIIGGQVYDAETMVGVAPRVTSAPYLFFKDQGVQPDVPTRAQGECGCAP